MQDLLYGVGLHCGETLKNWATMADGAITSATAADDSDDDGDDDNQAHK